MPQPINDQNKPKTEYHDAGIPDGPSVWIAGFGERGSGWRNHTGAMPVEQDPSYDDDLMSTDVPIFRNTTGNDFENANPALKKGISRA